MQGQDWGNLLRRIPAAYHEGLTLATVTETEVVVSSIIQLEEDFLILRGRTAGSSDGGKIIILPFKQINFLCFRNPLSEAEVAAIFGKTNPNFAALPTELHQTNGETPSDEEIDFSDEEMPGDEPQLSEEDKPSPVKASKSLLLARIRERLASDSSKPRVK